MDQALQLVKHMQTNKESSQFKSSTERFKIEQVDNKAVEEHNQFLRELKINKNYNVMFGKGNQTEKNSASKDLEKPFDSSSPRFDYRVQDIKLALKSPGPGAYEKSYEELENKARIEIQQTGTIGNKYVTSLGVENREKHSLFG